MVTGVGTDPQVAEHAVCRDGACHSVPAGDVQGSARAANQRCHQDDTIDEPRIGLHAPGTPLDDPHSNRIGTLSGSPGLGLERRSRDD